MIKDIVIQGISIVGMTINVLSYQRKTQRGILSMQLVGGALFCIHYILLGAIVGGLLNAFAVVRAIVYSDRARGRDRRWLFGFIAAILVIYALNFTALGAKPTLLNLLLELLPVIGMIASSIGMSYGDAAMTRRFSFINSPAWLIYNSIKFSLGGIICEAISLISITVGTIRLDLRGRGRKKSDSESQITT